MTTREQARRYLPEARELVRKAGGIILQSGARNDSGDWVIAFDLAKSVSGLPRRVGPVQIVFEVAEFPEIEEYLAGFGTKV